MNGKVFIYCERGLDPGFWAEPLNAVTNGAFILAGLACLWLWSSRPERSMLTLGLCLLMLAIGLGSFLFHTVAERWAGIADTAPIGLYMLLAVYVTARRFFTLPIWASWLGVALFVGLMAAAFQIRGGFSTGYLPALLVLLGSGAVLLAMGRRPGDAVLAAGLIFAASLTFRTLDGPYCEALSLAGEPIGSHFLWHPLNAATLYLVTRSAIVHGRSAAA